MFSTRVGDYVYLYNQLFNKNSEKFLFGDTDDLVEKLSLFLESRSKYGALLKESNYRLKCHFNWGQIAKQTVELYASLTVFK